MTFVGRGRGVVIRWNAEKKYGFSSISHKLEEKDFKKIGQTEDAFIYHNEINMKGVRKLVPGQIVEFDMYKNKNGIKAMNVDIVSSSHNENGVPNGNV